MSNRQLSAEELKKIAIPLLKSIRKRLINVTGGDKELLWALRRKIFKELMYDERGKPVQRRALKLKKWKEQNGKCAVCRKQLPVTGSILDRLKAMPGYTRENTRLLCPKCDWKIQEAEKFKGR